MTKYTSDITAGRVVLYRVTKIMEIFREKTGDDGLYSVTALINTVVLRCRRNIAVRIH